MLRLAALDVKTFTSEIFFLQAWIRHNNSHTHYYLKVITLAHNLKKEYQNLNNFSFGITDNHLHRYGKNSADLAANFKLTNQNVVRA